MSKITLGGDFRQIINSLPEFSLATPLQSPSFKAQLFNYLKYYHLPVYNNKEIALTIGKFETFNFQVAVQVYQKLNLTPENCKGVVVFIHGYLEHFGVYKNYINLLVENNYMIIGLDLPGHGLSTGKPAYIVDFGQYAHSIEILTGIIAEKYKHFQVPWYLSGFSAGAAIGTEYLFRNSANTLFQKALWFAPLLRIPKWRYTELACWLLPIIKFAPRESVCTSHDPSFVTFMKYNDPLQAKMVPLQWVNALHHWVARLAKHKPLPIATCIIQGTNDKTIDWKFNVPNLARIYPNHRVHYIPDGNHSLCNESLEYRSAVFNYVKNFLNSEE